MARCFIISSPVMAIMALLVRRPDDLAILGCPTPELNDVCEELMELNEAKPILRIDLRSVDNDPRNDTTHIVVGTTGGGTPPKHLWSPEGPRFWSTASRALSNACEWLLSFGGDELVLGNPHWWLDQAMARKCKGTDIAFGEDGMRPYVSALEAVGLLDRARKAAGWPWLHLVTGVTQPRAEAVLRTFPGAYEGPATVEMIPWADLEAIRTPQLDVDYSGSILVLSQCLSEDGFLDIADELRLLTSAVIDVADLTGKTSIVVKQHPRDHPEKVSRLMDALVDHDMETFLHPGGRFPIETEFSTLRGSGTPIVGFWTASLFYYSAFWERERSYSALGAVGKHSRYHRAVADELRRVGLLDHVRLLDFPRDAFP